MAETMSAPPDFTIISFEEQHMRFNACHKFIQTICNAEVKMNVKSDNIQKWMQVFCKLVTDAGTLTEDDTIWQVMNAQKKNHGSTQPIAVIEVLIWALERSNAEHGLALGELNQMFALFGQATEGEFSPMPWDNTKMLELLLQVLQETQPVPVDHIFPNVLRFEIVDSD